MARTPRNRININITDVNNVSEYLTQFSSMDIQAAGGYSKNINNDGWVTQSGGLDVSSQGHIKAMVWSVSILSMRAGADDPEAQQIIANICPIANAASNFQLTGLSASIEVKPEGDTAKVENVNNHIHTYQPNN
jgi:hypothetical protein|tara:strand:- start:790 stop:1191 length:402 start_codon:yes stop_codon:yes gene_type:complete